MAGTGGMAYLESPGLSTRPQCGRGGRHPAKARGGACGADGTGGVACSGYRDPSARPRRGRGAVTRQRRWAARTERKGWPILNPPAFQPARSADEGAPPGKGEGQRPRRGRNGRRGLFRIPRSFSPPAARTRGRHPAKARAARTEREAWPVPDAAILQPARSADEGPSPGKGEGQRGRNGSVAYLESPGLSTRPRRRTGKAAVGRANFCRREKTQRPAPFAMERGRVGFGPKALTVGTAGVIRTHRAAARSHGTLDGRGKLALMLGAGAGHAAGQDLAALAGVLHAQAHHVLIVDMLNLVHAELADLAARLAAAGGGEPVRLYLQTLLFSSLFGRWTPAFRTAVRRPRR